MRVGLVVELLVLVELVLVLVVEGLDGFMLGPDGGSDPAVAEPGGRATAAAIEDSAGQREKENIRIARVSTQVKKKITGGKGESRKQVAHNLI